jgi:hypothetical protein
LQTNQTNKTDEIIIDKKNKKKLKLNKKNDCLKQNFKKLKKTTVSKYISDVVKDLIKTEFIHTINKFK